MGSSFHGATFGILGFEPKRSAQAMAAVADCEHRLGTALPASVREWYGYEGAIGILAEHSNDDHPIPVDEFAVTEWQSLRLLPIQHENQWVCTWAVSLDGSDDPPVYVDVDSNGAVWHLLVSAFSTYVYTCVWDYRLVLNQRLLVQAQNDPISLTALNRLSANFSPRASTSGWPGSTQHRFMGEDQAILIWASEGQADWFVGAKDEHSLEAALKVVWNLDHVGEALFSTTERGESVLASIVRGE